MAKPDRNPELMKEMFGTTSLITDYVPVQKDTLTLDDIITEMEAISAPTYQGILDCLAEKTRASTEAASNVDEKARIWNDYLVTFGYECGKKRLAEIVLQLIEKLQ